MKIKDAYKVVIIIGLIFVSTLLIGWLTKTKISPELKFSLHTDNFESLEQYNSTKIDVGAINKRLGGSAIQKKLNMESLLNARAAKNINAYSDEKRYQLLIEKGFDLPTDLLERVRAGNTAYEDEKLIQLLLAADATEEENFWMEMKDQKSFHDLKALVEQMQNNNGHFYGDDLLKEGITYKDATADDIVSVLNTGAQLPDDVLQKIVAMDNVDLAVELYKDGVALNTGYVDPLSTMTPIEFLVELYSIAPHDYQKLINDVKKLMAIGAPLNVNDDTRDTLDILLSRAIAHNERMSEEIVKAAVELNALGVPLGESHKELLTDLSRKHPNIFNTYGILLK